MTEPALTVVVPVRNVAAYVPTLLATLGRTRRRDV